MSSLGGKNCGEFYSCAAPGPNMSQSSPDSGMTGASSADATIMTMQTGSMVSREGSAIPPEGATSSTSRAKELKGCLQTFGRSASPSAPQARSPKAGIDKPRTTSGCPELRDERREAQLLESLRSLSMACRFLHEYFSLAIWIHYDTFICIRDLGRKSLMHRNMSEP